MLTKFVGNTSLEERFEMKEIAWEMIINKQFPAHFYTRPPDPKLSRSCTYYGYQRLLYVDT